MKYIFKNSIAENCVDRMQASDEAGVEGRPGKLSSLSQQEQLLMSQLFKKKQDILQERYIHHTHLSFSLRVRTI